METKNLSNPQADTDAQFVKFRHPAETMKRISGNPALREKMIFLRKTGSVSPKETTCFSEGYVSFLRKKQSACLRKIHDSHCIIGIFPLLFRDNPAGDVENKAYLCTRNKTTRL